MWWWDFVVDTIHSLIKNGLSWATLAGVVVLFLKNRRIKKQLQKHLPPAFRDRDDERLDLIIHQNNEIIRKLGGEPCPSAKQSKQWITSSVIKPRSFSIFTWAGSITARIASRFTNYQRNGRVERMKWLNPEFLTFVVGAVVVLLNDQFGWGLTQEGVIAFFLTVGGYFLQQGIVNVKRGQDGSFAGISANSRKLIFTLVGALFIGLNEAMQLGFGQDAVWTVAGLVTGYNTVEGTKDVKAAAAQPTEVHFPAPIGFERKEDGIKQSH